MEPASPTPAGRSPAGAALPTLLIVCGHPRSGTSMLRRLLNTHPDVMITMEFRNFSRLGSPPAAYLRRLRWGHWRESVAQLTHAAPRWRQPLDDLLFRLGYAVGIQRRCRGKVALPCIRSTLHALLPWASVVGDKNPGYVYKLERMSARPGLRRIVIYRDCRDVVSSTLAMTATRWRHKAFAADMDTAAKVAARWVDAIVLQERHADAILAVSYEELVTHPELELMRIGDYLELDPSGFRPDLLRASSIGRHRSSLPGGALAEIEAIAGPTMRRLGFE